MENTVMTVTVSALNNYIKRVMDNNSYLKDICVKGEISNYKAHSSGHIYMTLKDEGSVIKAVMFKGAARLLRFNMENGMKIIARGRVSVYEAGGQYQMYIESVQPDGVGALYVAYEQLKAKLSEEGLFDNKYKKPIPKYPDIIGVVTAQTGAAVRDIINVLKRRYPLAKVRVLPVLVQGDGAGAEVAQAIDYLNEHKLCDVIIAGRGGGSIEDLWAFNEECVARAIFKSEIPVISAVGHEVDFTIADFVADMRAPTPSAAAEIAVPNSQELMQYLMSVKSNMFLNVSSLIEKKKYKLSVCENNPSFKMFKNFLKDKEVELDSLISDMEEAMNDIIKTKKETFLNNIGKLEALSPLKVLARGYSVAFSDDGKIIKTCTNVKSGDKIKVRVTDGDIPCVVE